jgi:(p)ppGpp synthase/HD superfamily hydrolase
MEDILNQVRDYADKAHGSQMRKYTPERYIVHPIRVMETCRNFDPSPTLLAAALLHDVLEDTDIKSDEMLAFLNTVMDKPEAEKTLSLVQQLTDVYTKTAYPQLNRKERKKKEHERIATISPKAQTIKYADIIDNTREIIVEEPSFAPRYLKECKEALSLADKGNEELYKIAKNEVKNGLDILKWKNY